MQLRRIGNELVERHGERLTRLGIQHDIRSVDARIAGVDKGASSRRTSSASGTPCQCRELSSSCVVAIDLMRPSRAATNSAIDLLVSRVRDATAETVASTFLTRWSSSEI